MIWALIEVVLPMLLTFLFGLLLGWLWWRRSARHTVARNAETDNKAHALKGAVAEAAEAADGRNFSAGDETGTPVVNAVLSESGQQERPVREQALAKELTAANASIRSLVAELDVTRTRLQSCEKRMRASGIEVSSASLVVAGTGNTVRETIDRGDTDAASADQLRQLQQKYQQLETSQIIDKAELAKKHHLESRLHSLSKELTENKNELADARKTASQLQAELDALSNKASNGRQNASSAVDQSGNSPSDATQSDGEIAHLRSRIAEIAPLAEQARDYQSQVAALQARLQQSESKVRRIEQSGERIDHLDSQLQTRLADELEQAQQQVQSLTLKASQSTEKAAELVRIRSKVATLESELGEANSRGEDAEKLAQRVNELEAMLKGSEVKAVNEKLVEAEAQLRIANNRVADQQQQINRLQGEAAGITDIDDATTETGAEVNVASAEDSTESEAGSPSLSNASGSAVSGAAQNNAGAGHAVSIEESARAHVATAGSTESAAAPPADLAIADEVRQQRGAEQQGADRKASGDSDSEPDPELATDSTDGDEVLVAAPAKQREIANQPAKKRGVEAPSWQSGVTKFGTPAASHKDDLKVIRGIGPVLERTLNEAEIQTWDQLAALTAQEVKLIEQSIDFPGRMTREHWVEQAIELVELYPDTGNRPRGKNLLPKKTK